MGGKLLSSNLRNLCAGTGNNDTDLIRVSHCPDFYLNPRLLRYEVDLLQTNQPTAPFNAFRKKISLYVDNYSFGIFCVRSNPISTEQRLAARLSSIKHDLKVLLCAIMYFIPEPSDFGENGDDVKHTRFHSAVISCFLKRSEINCYHRIG
jgi:hypothetical protein